MKNVHFKLLLILSAAPHAMTALEVKRVGRYWFLPWEHMEDMLEMEWVSCHLGFSFCSDEGVPATRFYRITQEGRRAVSREVARRVHA